MFFTTAECEPLPDFPNGMISYAPDMTANYSVGTVATYTCDSGFRFVPGVGNRMRHCEDQGSTGDPISDFNGTEPRCERK